MLSNAEDNFRHFIRQIKVPEEGREGEPGTVRVSPANKKLFPTTRHRRLAGRDPTLPQSRDWSPERRNAKGFFLLSFISYPVYPVNPC